MREFDRVAAAFERALAAADAEEQRRRQEKADHYPDWLGWGRLIFRSPGHAQIRVLKVLWEFADPRSAGLPVAAVVEISRLEKSNVRRALAGLLDRGYLDTTPDGKRVRITPELERHYLEDWLFPAPPLEAARIDPTRAVEILKRCGEDVTPPDPQAYGVTLRRSSRKFSDGRRNYP
jgi:hypothetical protein